MSRSIISIRSYTLPFKIDFLAPFSSLQVANICCVSFLVNAGNNKPKYNNTKYLCIFSTHLGFCHLQFQFVQDLVLLQCQNFAELLLWSFRLVLTLVAFTFCPVWLWKSYKFYCLLFLEYFHQYLLAENLGYFLLCLFQLKILINFLQLLKSAFHLVFFHRNSWTSHILKFFYLMQLWKYLK